MIAIRSEREIKLLREANQIVVAVHEALKEMVAPGVTTIELDKKAESIIAAHGAKSAFKGYHGYPAITCISVDEVIVHGIPGDRKLREGEIVSIDVGVEYQGYFGDAAVTWAVGEVDEMRRHLMYRTDLALSRAVRAARVGNYLQDIGIAVQSTCEPEGLGVVRDFVGHGIGTAMHEDPQIANFDTGQRGPLLKEGMVLAIEPMVNAGAHGVRVLADKWTAVTSDGKPSAHYEHSVVVRPGGGEILSKSDTLVWGQRPEPEEAVPRTNVRG